MPIVLIVLGLVLLVVGGELVVRGASRLAECARIVTLRELRRDSAGRGPGAAPA